MTRGGSSKRGQVVDRRAEPRVASRRRASPADRGEGVQICRVRRDRRRRQAALNAQVVEVRVDRRGQLCIRFAWSYLGRAPLRALAAVAREHPRRPARPPRRRRRRASGRAPSAARRSSSVLDLRHGPAVTLQLLDAQMAVGIGRDLRQMRDAYDLVVARQAPQHPTDWIRRAPTDARIHLVEDERGRVVGACQHRLERQRDARHLAARGDAGQRARRLAGIGREQERDGVRRRLSSSACSTTCDVERGRREAQLDEQLRDGRRAACRPSVGARASALRAAARAASKSRCASIERSSRCSSMLRRRSPRPEPLAIRHERLLASRRTCASGRRGRRGATRAPR